MSRLALLGSVALSLAACGQVDHAPTVAEPMGLALSVDTLGDSDVRGVHIQATRVACNGSDEFHPATETRVVDLTDGVFHSTPAKLPWNSELDPASRHIGSDLFIPLLAGCYDVRVTPARWVDTVDMSFEASGDCDVVTSSRAEVLDGKTTELALASFCDIDHNPHAGDDNERPVFKTFTSKFWGTECDPTRVCVDVTDEDNDPVDAQWWQTDSSDLFELDPDPAQLVGTHDGQKVWRICANIVPGEPGLFDFKVKIRDRKFEGSNKVSPGGSRTQRFWLDAAARSDWGGAYPGCN